jgi:hypothetical protein
MDKKKLVILVLVLIAVLVLMALGAGAYRDRKERGNKPSSYSAGSGMKLIDGAIGWMRSKFDLSRLSGCGASGSTLTFQGDCRLTVLPGSSRPSQFTLEANSSVTLCFALTEGKLTECLISGKDEKLENASDFTVAGDSAFLALRCHQQQGSCLVVVSRD